MLGLEVGAILLASRICNVFLVLLSSSTNSEPVRNLKILSFQNLTKTIGKFKLNDIFLHLYFLTQISCVTKDEVDMQVMGTDNE